MFYLQQSWNNSAQLHCETERSYESIPEISRERFSIKEISTGMNIYWNMEILGVMSMAVGNCSAIRQCTSRKEEGITLFTVTRYTLDSGCRGVKRGKNKFGKRIKNRKKGF